jgi:isoaspartyl peptidase/L-asparaginase-like protein (Ntn-hydrolase superfamily)
VTSITPVLLVHGGAGNPSGGRVDDEPEHHAALRDALLAGYELLTAGAPALDAAEAAVRSLEERALFNAGRGSVLTADGRVEMDAAVMDGAVREAGACAGITSVRHPVSLARAIMEKTPHVVLVAEGAERFAADLGLDFEDPEWFVTDRERERHAKTALADAGAGGDAASAGDARRATGHGTVGAVALDSAGHLAAATSTGGVRGQLPGRVGDTPLIGAGTWADDRVAVSCTGAGERFIRAAAAHELSARVRHGGASVSDAARAVIDTLEGEGGLIAVGSDGSFAMPFNTAVMYRGRAAGGSVQTSIWPDQEEKDG